MFPNKSGQKCYITSAFSGISIIGEQKVRKSVFRCQKVSFSCCKEA